MQCDDGATDLERELLGAVGGGGVSGREGGAGEFHVNFS